MQTAISILRRAQHLILFNPGGTLRSVAPGIVIYVLAMGLGIVLLGPQVIGRTSTQLDILTRSGGEIALLVAILILSALGLAVSAVFWHRYSLLEGEARERIMIADAGLVLRYVVAAIVIGLAILLAAVLFGIVLMLIAAVVPIGGPMAAFLMSSLPALLVLTWVMVWAMLRGSMILPATALGEPLGLWQSWRATAPLSRSLWILSALFVVLDFAATLIIQNIGAVPLIGVLVSISWTLVVVLFGNAVLSTIYGHCIQNRALA